MKKVLALIVCIILSLNLVGCGEDVPELIKPKSMINAYYVVTKGTIYDVNIYNGYVSPASEYYACETDSIVSEVNFNIGDHVKKGDVIYVLNAECEEEIAKIDRKIEEQKILNEYYVEEHRKFIQNEKNSLNSLAGFDREVKKLEIEKQETQFKYDEQLYENILNDLLVSKEDLMEIKNNSSIVANSAGTISYLSAKTVDAKLTAKRNCVIISDDNKLVVNFPLEVSQKIDKFDDSYIQIGSNKYYDYTNCTQPEETAPITSDFQLKDSSNIKCGDYAAFFAITNKAENVLYVPNEAIKYNSSDNSYYVLLKDEKDGKKVTVTKGVETKYNTEITSGLNENDEIIYTYDETVSGTQYKYDKVVTGKYIHKVALETMNKYGFDYENILNEIPGKIGTINIDNTEDVYVEKGDVLFTIFSDIEDSKVEQAKNDLNQFSRDYDDKIQEYNDNIKNLELALKDSTDTAEKISLQNQLDELKDGYEDFVTDLDETQEQLQATYDAYVLAQSGDEVEVVAPYTGILNISINLVSGSTLKRDDVIGNIYSTDRVEAFINDNEHVLKYGQNITITSIHNGVTNNSSAKVISAANIMEDGRYAGANVIFNNVDDFINLHTKVAKIEAADIEIDNVVLVPRQSLYFNEDKNYYYVYLSYNDYIVKHTVEPAFTDFNGINLVWIKSGLNNGDVVVKYE